MLTSKSRSNDKEFKNVINTRRQSNDLMFNILYSPIIKQHDLIIEHKIMLSTMLLTWHFALLSLLYFWEIIMPVVSSTTIIKISWADYGVSGWFFGR